MKSTGAKQSKNAAKRDVLGDLSMKQLKPIESLILTIRGRKVLIDADLASNLRGRNSDAEPGRKTQLRSIS